MAVTYENNDIAGSCFYMKFLEELLDDDTKEDVVAALKEGVSDRYIYNCNYTEYFDARQLTAHAIRSSCYPSISHNFDYNPKNNFLINSFLYFFL